MDPWQEIKLKYSFASIGYGLGQFNGPYGICAIPNRIIVSGFLNHMIQIFDSMGGFIYSFGTKRNATGQSYHPKGICTLGGNVLIADADNNRIQILDSWMNHISFIDLGEFAPETVSPSNDGNILVTTKGSVLIVSPEGHIIKTFGSSGNGDGQFMTPDGVCTNSRDEILRYRDRKRNKVQIFNKDGKFLRSFGSKGDGKHQFNVPCGICVDCNDNIYVADAVNNRISIFDSEWNLIQRLPFKRPTSVCLMNRRMIVASCEHESVAIFSN